MAPVAFHEFLKTALDSFAVIVGATAVAQAFVFLYLKRRSSERLELEVPVEVTLKVGETRQTFDLNDPESAADYLEALEQAKLSELHAQSHRPKHAAPDAGADV